MPGRGRDHRRRILALLPGLSGFGGIQQHNRMFFGVVEDWAVDHDCDLDIVSLGDPRGWIDERYLTHPVQGAGGDRYRFGALSALALARPYDLLIVGVVDFGILLSVPRLLRRRAPVMTLVHGLEVWQPLPRAQRAALTQADRVVSVSNYTAGQVVGLHGVNAENVITVPIPLDPAFVREAEAFRAGDIPSRPSSVLSTARMNRIDAGKGIETMIRAMAQVAARRPEARYVIVGDGDDRPRLEALAAELGVQGAVHFAGPVSAGTLHAYLAGTEIFALPSRKEGFGIVFLEAMEYSKPVIARAHGGSPEVVQDGVTGLLVEYADVPALVRVLTYLLDDDERRKAMGEAGHRAVGERFGYDRFRERVCEVLDGLTSWQKF